MLINQQGEDKYMLSIETMLKMQGWSTLEEKEAHDDFLDQVPGLREQFDLLGDQLANNEFDSDEELKAFFIENGVSEHFADEAIALRDDFLTNPLAQLCVRNGKLAVRHLRIQHG
jgi:hypothetical protein